MAEVTHCEEKDPFAAGLKRALVEGLGIAGISAEISIEPVPNTKLRRVIVYSDQFDNLEPLERQDLVWRIINREFTPDQQLLISMIMTLARADLAADEGSEQASEAAKQKQAKQEEWDKLTSHQQHAQEYIEREEAEDRAKESGGQEHDPQDDV